MSNNDLYSEVSPETKEVKQQARAKANGEPTVLERLSATIAAKVRREDVYIDVPERKGVKLRISPNITQSQVKGWRKQAGEDSRQGMDGTKFACYVIGHTTDGILFNDEEVHDEDGYGLNFASPSVLKMTDTTRPIPEAVRAFFGLDPHVEAAAVAILDASGFGDTIEAMDPTKESLTN